MAEVNYMAVAAAALAGFVIGMLWYSPLLFGKCWMKLVGMTEAECKKGGQIGMAPTMLLGLAGAGVTAYFLAQFLQFTGMTSMADGAKMAVFVWLGFVTFVQMGSFLWEQKSIKLYLLNTSYELVKLVTMSLILTAWV